MNKFAGELTAVMRSESCPLAGVALVEASAGAGKTYTIQELFLRLVAEKALPVESILVMTFTIAATAELKTRLRQILDQARRFFIDPAVLDAPVRNRIARLLGNAISAVPRIELRRRLQTAMLDFDNAAIFTIHAFCRKALADHAFESGILFNTEIRTDQDHLLQEQLNDFVRRTFYPDNDAGLRAGLKAVTSFPDRKHFDLIRDLISRDSLQVNSGLPPDFRIEKLCTQIAAVLDTAAAACRRGMLTGSLSGLRMNRNFGLEDLARYEERLLRWRADRDLNGMFELFREFFPSVFPNHLHKKQHDRLPALFQQPFFAAMAKLEPLLAQYRTGIGLAAAHAVKFQLAAQKQRENFRTFDDLPRLVLTMIRDGQSRLAAILKKHYRAAVVDEFQDTDPVQYEICAELFGRREDPCLFMVGDPKQAIYAFRGGDIAVYRRAREECRQQGGVRYVLNRNYRSAPALIEAVNRLFTINPLPFADPEIAFHPVEPGTDEHGRVKSGLTLPDGSEERHPFKICWINGMRSKTDLRARTFSACANDIVSLLSSELRIPGGDGVLRRLRPSDVAVLVFRREDMRAMRSELAARRVPCVIPRAGNVYESTACGELRTVLRAVLAPYDPQTALEAMQTAMLGYDAGELIRLRTQTASALGEAPEKLAALLNTWRRGSFIEMFQNLLRTFRVREHLLAAAGGERMLTDLLQLRDLLHREAVARELAPGSILAFLVSQSNGEKLAVDEEEKETLMETDRAAVMITTVHQSKGLEYPVALLPGLFQWDCVYRPGVFHDERGVLLRDLTETETSRSAVSLERLQELMRLAYVAVTRAQYACRLYWGGCKTGRTALDWLFQNVLAERSADAVCAHILAGFKVADLQDRLGPEWFVPENTSFRVWLPDQAKLPELRFTPWHGLVDREFHFTSFSALASGGRTPGTVRDYDGAEPDRTTAPPEGIFRVPAGKATGNAWHEILAKIDFTAFDPEKMNSLIARTLRGYGVGSSEETVADYAALTAEMIGNVLNTPLPAADGSEFTLNTVSMTDRLSELEFCCRFRAPFRTNALSALLERYAPAVPGRNCPPIREQSFSGGCLNGAVDLLFRKNGLVYLADWKSNRLTGNAGGFTPEEVKKEMLDHKYFLQYLIYGVGVLKYLSLHLGHRVAADEYDRLFGGVYYLFLRGMAPACPGRGVFYDRPPYELIQQLDELIG